MDEKLEPVILSDAEIPSSLKPFLKILLEEPRLGSPEAVSETIERLSELATVNQSHH
jgi:hypothetical protein